MTGRVHVVILVCCVSQILLASGKAEDSVCTSSGEWISVDQFGVGDSPLKLCRFACMLQNKGYTAIQRMETDMKHVACFCGTSRPIASEEPCIYFCGDGACGGRKDTKSVYSTCPKGYYGVDCKQICSGHCLNSECNFSGECLSCPDGYRGPSCYDRCHCLGLASSCNTNSSVCEAGCENGYYAADCTKTCSDGCRDRVCDQHTGICTNGCYNGHYLKNCSKTCYRCQDEACDQQTGQCTNGCRSGYYTQNCTSECPDNCLENICDRHTGSCTKGCDRGYYSENCSLPCPEYCSSGCDQKSGICINGCSYGQYSLQCTEECPRDCRECEFLTGECKRGCSKGLYGRRCNKLCPNYCLDGCDREYGKCDHVALPIWLLAVVEISALLFGVIVTGIVCKCKQKRKAVETNASPSEHDDDPLIGDRNRNLVPGFIVYLHAKYTAIRSYLKRNKDQDPETN